MRMEGDMRDTVTSRTKEDPTLGLVRFCGRCKEWLPSDSEFFYIEERRRQGPRGVHVGTYYHCIACKNDDAQRSVARRIADGRLIRRRAAVVPTNG